MAIKNAETKIFGSCLWLMILFSSENNQRHFAGQRNEQNGASPLVIATPIANRHRKILVVENVLFPIKTIDYGVFRLGSSDNKDPSPCRNPIGCNTCLKGYMAVAGIRPLEDLLGS